MYTSSLFDRSILSHTMRSSIIQVSCKRSEKIIGLLHPRTRLHGPGKAWLQGGKVQPCLPWAMRPQRNTLWSSWSGEHLPQLQSDFPCKHFLQCSSLLWPPCRWNGCSKDQAVSSWHTTGELWRSQLLKGDNFSVPSKSNFGLSKAHIFQQSWSSAYADNECSLARQAAHVTCIL